MKRICLLLVSLLLGTAPTLGQEKSEQDLAFIYIAHDEYTAVQSLIERLKEAFADAINYPESRAVIFYLANAENPIVVQVNTKNDNQQEFNRIVDELQTKRSHNVEPMVDRARIQEIFNADDLIDDEGKGLYRSAEWTYYVNSTFWALMYNESVIASLFFIMDMEEMIESGYLRVNIMHGADDTLPYNEESPFGSKALCASKKFLPMPY